MRDQNKATKIDSKYIKAPKRYIKDMEIGEIISINTPYIDIDSDNKAWVYLDLEIRDNPKTYETYLKLKREGNGYILIIEKEFNNSFTPIKHISSQYSPIIDIIYE